VLDTHDGIGVIDVGADADGSPGLLKPEQIDGLVETIHKLSNGQSKQATGAAANNLDLYQVNCTYLDALGRDGTLYLIARTIQFFVPGIPQVYYVGFLGGTNDMELLARTQVGRDINRHHFSYSEIDARLKDPLVTRLIELIRLRNSHPAFGGECVFESARSAQMSITWRSSDHFAKLHIDLSVPRASIDYSLDASNRTIVID
jgi:sucrose phosphorylase